MKSASNETSFGSSNMHWANCIWLSCSILSFVNILLHCTGLYLHVYIYLKVKKSCRQLYLINLTFSEILWSIGCVFRYAIHFYENHYEIYIQIKHLDRVHFLRDVGIWAYYSAMFLLTGDTIHCCVFHISHRLVTVSKTKKIILVSWVPSVAIHLYLFLRIDSEDNERYFRGSVVLYSSITLAVTYLLFSMFAYVAIFINAAKSTRTSQPNLTIIQIIKKSPITLSALLVGSYLCLAVLPNIIYFWLVQKRGSIVLRVATILYDSSWNDIQRGAFFYTEISI